MLADLNPVALDKRGPDSSVNRATPPTTCYLLRADLQQAAPRLSQTPSGKTLAFRCVIEHKAATRLGRSLPWKRTIPKMFGVQKAPHPNRMTHNITEGTLKKYAHCTRRIFLLAIAETV